MASTKQYLEFLQEERDSATLYRALAEIEKDPRIAEIYRRLAAVEDKHAAAWSQKLREAGQAAAPYQASWR